MSVIHRSEREPRRWTEDEDGILRSEAQVQLSSTGVVSDWNSIATKLPMRSNKDCRKRWTKIYRAVNKGSWSPSEDARLTSAVAKHGLCWTQVASDVGTRHADQCAKRWQHALDPCLNHSKWAPDEDTQLLQSVEKFGREWRQISQKVFADRSPTNLKNRYAILTGYGNGRSNAASKGGRSERGRSNTVGNESAWGPDGDRADLRHSQQFCDGRSDSIMSSDIEMYGHMAQQDSGMSAISGEAWSLSLMDMGSGSSNQTPEPYLQPLVENQAMLFDNTQTLDPSLLTKLNWEGGTTTPNELQPSSNLSIFDHDQSMTDGKVDGQWAQQFLDQQSSSRVMLEMQDCPEDTLREVTNILYRDRVRVKMDISH